MWLWELNYIFSWLLLHGRILTYDLLHTIIVGTSLFCLLCGLEEESIGHLFLNCPKINFIWCQVNSHLGFNSNFNESIQASNWITKSEGGEISPFALVFVVVVWMIWKARCDIIFKKAQIDINWIVDEAFGYIKEYKRESRHKLGKLLLNSDHSPYHNMLLFTDASWVFADHVVVMGVIIISTYMKVLLEGW